jgi:hypothetical protein
MNTRSNLERSESGRLMFFAAGSAMIYSPYLGLAAATTLHLALRLA